MKNHISSSAIIGRVKLGRNIYIGNNSVIGTQPQYVGFNKNKILSAKFKNLIVSDNVVIMDLCHIHAGIKRNTKIGKDTMIMSGTHIGHDVQIGKGCNVSPNVAFAGEVTLKNNVTPLRFVVNLYKFVSPISAAKSDKPGGSSKLARRISRALSSRCKVSWGKL